MDFRLSFEMRTLRATWGYSQTLSVCLLLRAMKHNSSERELTLRSIYTRTLRSTNMMNEFADLTGMIFIAVFPLSDLWRI
jgi:hypothetical protein